MKHHAIVLAFLPLALYAASAARGDQAPANDAEQAGGAQPVTIDLWYLKIDEQADQAPEAQLGKADWFADLDDREAVIDSLAELEEQGRIASSYYMQGATLAGHELVIRVGQRKPTVQGVARSRSGVSRSITYQDVGMIIEATPSRISGRRLQIQLQFEESSVAESDVEIHSSVEGAESFRAARIDSVVTHTIVDLSLGRPRVVMRTAGARNDRPGGHVLVICARGDAE